MDMYGTAIREHTCKTAIKGPRVGSFRPVLAKLAKSIVFHPVIVLVLLKREKKNLTRAAQPTREVSEFVRLHRAYLKITVRPGMVAWHCIWFLLGARTQTPGSVSRNLR